jgi:glucose-1-phosphatase
MPLRLALFDMDDVLCDYLVDRRVACLARMAGCSEAQVRAAIWDSDYFDAADQGRWTAEESLAEFSRRLGHSFTREAWIEARRIAMVPRPGVLAMVEQVKARAAVAVLTNNDELLAETVDSLFPELRPVFGANIFVSARFKAAKPDPQVYRACCGLIGVAPEETFFTDDKPENVAGAVAAGLTGHVYDSEAGLAAALRRAGLL